MNEIIVAFELTTISRHDKHTEAEAARHAHGAGDVVLIRNRSLRGTERTRITQAAKLPWTTLMISMALYLDDGTNRRCPKASEFARITDSWQEIDLPLSPFAAAGVDLSPHQVLQIDFEWDEMAGAIYVVGARFKRSDTKHDLTSARAVPQLP